VTLTLQQTFAANRATGRIALEVAGEAGRTRRVRVGEEGSLRVRFPNARGGDSEAVVVNTAGGMAGGDAFSFDLRARAGADLTLTTAAAEKIYRAMDDASRIDVRLTVEPGARLAWLPQESILFDRTRLERSITIDLVGDAQVAVAEAVVFGRALMGEQVAEGSLIDRWRVSRDGRLVFAETFRIEGAVAEKLAHPAIGNGAVALATVLISPGTDAHAEAFRALADDFIGEAGISCWNGLCVARFCAQNSAALRADMSRALAALDVVLPRIWLS
jgi:urease accessory protein